MSLRKLAPLADAEIFEKFPKLREQPETKSYDPSSGQKANEENERKREEPYRLYRFIVPPAFIESRTLAFAGAYRSPATINIAQAQALWITAYLGNDIPSLQFPVQKLEIADASQLASDPRSAVASRVEYETVLHTQFSKWRYSRGFGARFPELWFDCLPYVDVLLEDVGVRSRRKGRWWQEWFRPYELKDYEGIVGEFLRARESRIG
jgi:hypothetical protein